MAFNRERIGLAILVVLVTVVALYSWFRPVPVVTEKVFTPVPQVKEVVKIKRVAIPVEKVIVVEKEKAVEALKLPDEIAKDEKKQVIATGEVDPYEGKTEVVTVLDTGSGEASVLARRKPLPLFDVIGKKEIGIGYEVSSAGGQGAAVFGRWTLVRVGAIYGTVSVEMNQRPEAKIRTELSYRW
ncbi:MAG: hypothetical protein K8I29_19455 [Alphaproteobacteria bacterium]|uniref:Uncharacterized protein n=1 Tax=Candidatus Nitrobium versatile TaxID=2884831 RepID=A0A953SDV3_9BACT|nr:hypothetical protein [Candidatus Nitrobium versatile]